MELSKNDVSILRRLAMRLNEISLWPRQAERRALWENHNALHGARPMFLCDQLPWNELDEKCVYERAEVTEPSLMGVELFLRREIWKAENLNTDMVVDPYIKIRRPYKNTGYGLKSQVTQLKLDVSGDVSSQRMKCMINEPEDVEKILIPQISPDREAEEELRQAADEVFDGIMPWRFTGEIMHLGAWDTIAYWMGVENLYIELMDRPEMMHRIMERMTQAYISMAKDFEKYRLYDTCENYCHCSQTYQAGESPDREAIPANGWAFGLAQPFTSVSPKVTDEFECAYMKRVFPYFKNIYYGCCDRLDDRLEIVSALPNVRKLSCSPWSHREAFAEKLPRHIIMSNKPSPAFLATDRFDEDAVRKDIRFTVECARKNGVTLELILKDVSTVRYDIKRLQRFCDIAMEEIGG